VVRIFVKNPFRAPAFLYICVNMKRAGILFFSIFYFVVASGFSLSLHYCAGKLKSVSLFQDPDGGCCGGRKKSMDCCKDKALVYKASDKHQAAAKTLIPAVSVQSLITAPETVDAHLYRIMPDAGLRPYSNAPPFPGPEPVYLLHRNFRI